MKTYQAKIAIMQPYFFPYIGYYQLIYATDTFVILDDVNYIMRGWINRNNILLNNKSHMMIIPLSKPSQNKLISEIELSFSEKDRNSLKKTLEQAYKKAPKFKEVFPIVVDIIDNKEDNLVKFLKYSLVKVLDYLNIKRNILLSSALPKNNSLKSQERIIDICKVLHADLYVNPIGGMELYSSNLFSECNIDLKFIDTNWNNISYKQFSNEFLSGLSFLDVLMFNEKEQINEYLKEYTLIEGEK